MTTLDQIVAIAASIAPACVTVTARSTFEDLHFDSLDCIQFTVAVEDGFGVDIACVERISFTSLADVATLVDGRIRAELPLAA